MSEFDVFLCHNSQDKPEVIKIARKLQQQGLKPWLDIWELPPGISWQERLEEQIEQIKSAAVFVGNSGFGPWQKREMIAFLSEFVERGIPVIPVLLEDAPKKPKLPIFLKSLTWVDFRHSESNPMGRLIWGITQVKPDNFDSLTVAVVEKSPEVNKLSSKFENFTEDLGNGVELEMVAIPDGKFLMGSPVAEGYEHEKPQHKVIVKSFYMGKYPITQAQYQRIMGSNPSEFKGENRPVEAVSWKNTVDFCQKLSEKARKSYRLPSEAEWEYACRAGTTTAFSFGSELTPDLAKYVPNFATTVWHFMGMGDKTSEVGQYKPNKFGLYDTHGNVWEWCQDNWHKNYKNAPTDGSAWLSENALKVIRGGSYFNEPDNCRSAYRMYGIGHKGIGFRVVCAIFRTR